MAVYKQYRICRRHFESSCMNGACRRLLNTAVPTLHLNKNKRTLRSPNKDVSRRVNLTEVVAKEDSQLNNYGIDFSSDNPVDVLDEYLLESNDGLETYNTDNAAKELGMFCLQKCEEVMFD